jgi:hypothetical protein
VFSSVSLMNKRASRWLFGGFVWFEKDGEAEGRGEGGRAGGTWVG